MEFLQIIASVLILFIVVAILIYIMSFFSKIFGGRVVSRTGSPTASPEVFDGINEVVKDGSRSILTKIKAIDLKSYRSLKKSDKLEKLKVLKELNESGTITESELTQLKKEILHEAN